MTAKQTRYEFQPFCYKHQVEMKPKQTLRAIEQRPTQGITFACPNSDCLIHYNSAKGYFILTQDAGGNWGHLRPLCYEHHTEMSLVQMVSGNGSTPHLELEYACQVSDCFVRYTGVHGYFIAPCNGSTREEEILPHVRCPEDGAPMYLAQVRPEERSFRLWTCPLCKAASTSGQVLAAAS